MYCTCNSVWHSIGRGKKQILDSGKALVNWVFLVIKKGRAGETHARIKEGSETAESCCMAHVEGYNQFSCGSGNVGRMAGKSRAPLLEQSARMGTRWWGNSPEGRKQHSRMTCIARDLWSWGKSRRMDSDPMSPSHCDIWCQPPDTHWERSCFTHAPCWRADLSKHGYTIDLMPLAKDDWPRNGHMLLFSS